MLVCENVVVRVCMMTLRLLLVSGVREGVAAVVARAAGVRIESNIWMGMVKL